MCQRKTVIKLLNCLFLVGCTSALRQEPAAPPNVDTGVNVASVGTTSIAGVETVTYTYFLIPSQVLLEAEYDIQRNMLENIGTQESQLRSRAFEAAVGMIASMLDEKYNTHIQGDILPCAQVIIIKSDQEIDLALLKDLIEEDRE